MSFFHAIIENPLLLYAILAGFAASVVSGIIGSYVVVKRIVFISGGISHSVLSGIGICLWLDRVHGFTAATPLAGALISAIISALIIGWIHLYYREREDSVISALWSVGMAVGILFISQTPGFNVELTNYLVGNLLWVTPEDLYFLCALDVFVLITVFILHKRFVAVCFDEDHARLRGLPVNFIYLLLLVLIAITIVLLVAGSRIFTVKFYGELRKVVIARIVGKSRMRDQKDRGGFIFESGSNCRIEIGKFLEKNVQIFSVQRGVFRKSGDEGFCNCTCLDRCFFGT